LQKKGQKDLWEFSADRTAKKQGGGVVGRECAYVWGSLVFRLFDGNTNKKEIEKKKAKRPNGPITSSPSPTSLISESNESKQTTWEEQTSAQSKKKTKNKTKKKIEIKKTWNGTCSTQLQ